MARYGQALLGKLMLAMSGSGAVWQGKDLYLLRCVELG